ncbi:hypothetical protein QNN03_23100 [Streptomyces sp. GXMU-J15]|uniref:Integral membrane protein n=1 Tax=Streptomyces fuscus TaxID=3048495 RepID=A0ABT7J4R2_9ACTN|nr:MULTISPECIES: hypothetical protein [Streptomyces]MDL2079332.1 hypothetical protein [Streptomyces fuscus]
MFTSQQIASNDSAGTQSTSPQSRQAVRFRDRLHERFRRGLLATQRVQIDRHLGILDSLELADTVQKGRLRRDIRGAAARRASAAYAANLITTWLFSLPVIVIVIAVVLAHSEFPSGSSAGSLLSYMGGAGAAGVLMLAPAAAVALTTYLLAPSLGRLFEKLTLYTMFGSACLVFLFFAVTTWESDPNGSAFNATAASMSALTLSGIVIVANGSLAFNHWLTNYLDARWCRPYDHIALFLLGTAASIHRERRRWHDDSQVTKWRAWLEIVAAQVERDASLSRRFGTAEDGTHTELRDEARRIAAIVRSHKRTLAEAYSAHDVDAVVTSLVRGTQAFCAGDRTALLANAPDQAAPRVNRFAAAILRLIPAAVLIAAGIFLPLIPAIAQSELASSLRWYLIVMGAIMFVTTRQDLATKIGEAVAKVLFK